ncbi:MULTISPECIES: molybdenum-dependent transcriptional regulator [Halomicrobium]|uniref:Transcriptional regulator, ModE family n=2 Tax=Halomicrobium mukohataei TaxID=57705 RepID=C7P356_HALMD|nr:MULTISPECIES: TOBE domain-containing protein [Halomicrobium]ACV47528.1 transcriptional regulator, ModE family [Halomicrobium mukohataei DSM 12286]QCD65991.1 LysR family transcriptional regulator [Halomicrobium mukohataei]QFR20796.1 LysR family transcriptional regulator [Halomicrobium sp. ZPS1]
MDTDVAVSLTADGVTVDASDAALLRAVDSEGSLNAAATALGRSYSRAHKRLTVLEETLGSLVERERGGEGGGGSVLTDRGRELLTQFARVHTVVSGTAAADVIALSGTVRERSGRLVTAESPAGELHAIVVGGDRDPSVDTGDDVTVTLTADAVTLQEPDATLSATRTSARNRLRGTVTAVDERDGVATITVDVGAATPIPVLVTAASRARLDLEPGDPVVATFKATAARVTRLSEE